MTDTLQTIIAEMKNEFYEAVEGRISSDWANEWADRLQAIAEKSGWQPIETAPKDGTWVIVRLSNGEVFRARYAEMGNIKSWHVASDIGWVNAVEWMEPPK